MLRRLTHIALHPLFQALVLAGLFIAFVPLGLKKYNAEKVKMTSHFDQSQFLFTDLDHDNLSERIHTCINVSGNAALVVRTNLGPDQQRNFRGIYMAQSARLVIGDHNRDHVDEIFLFTHENDSILLHGIRFGKEPDIFIRNRYIATVGGTLKGPDYMILPGKVTDMTGDGHGDVVFGINTGFSRYPRNIFIYDIAHDTLFSSPRSGAFVNQFCMVNLDDDPFEEFTLFTDATDNFNEEPMLYHDSSSWMMALDHDLSFMFPPREFYGTTGNFVTYPVKSPGQDPVLFCIHRGFESGKPSARAIIADRKGEILRQRELNADYDFNLLQIFPTQVRGYPPDRILGYINEVGLFEIDMDLEWRKIGNHINTSSQYDYLDIDLDGKDEFIVPAADHERYFIYRNDFTHPAELDFPLQSVTPLYSVVMNGDGPPMLSIQGDSQWWLFSYGINPVYRYRFLVYLGVCLAFFGFIALIRRLYAIQLKRIYESERKITGLQLSSIKAQMEPHFIFNVINSIGSSIYREKKDEAYQMVVRFSSMVRTLLSTSDQIYRTLNEELEFVTNFLELEKQRFPESFNYSIRVDGQIDREMLLPKMILQFHAENALKHGLRPKGVGGLLEIQVSRQQDYLVMVIKDNGIGRAAAEKLLSQSTGRGLKMLAQLFETYNRHNPVPIRQEITDLFDDTGQPAGTMVKVQVPVEFNPDIY